MRIEINSKNGSDGQECFESMIINENQNDCDCLNSKENQECWIADDDIRSFLLKLIFDSA